MKNLPEDFVPYWDFDNPNPLINLCDDYLCEEEKDGILKHRSFHKPAGMGVDESLIWGDYFFIEAMMKINGEVK